MPLLVVCAAALLCVGCVEWLEVDEGEEDAYVVPVGEPLVLPSEPPLVDAPGPLVPRTPGLRVPLAGYWSRVRLDGLDALFPYTWASLSAAEGGPQEEAFAMLRVEGSTAQGDDPSEIGAQGVSGWRALIPIALPAETDASVIRDGFELGEKALAGATIGLTTASQDLWLVTATRLTFEKVTRTLIMGSLEGEARRGAQGQRMRRFAAAFIALRAPDDEHAPAAGPSEITPPDAGGPGGTRPL